jgi:hypothetical protein
MEGPVMSLSAWEQQALNSIKDGLADSDRELAVLLTTFNELASGQEMPVREKIRASSRRVIQRSRHRSRDKACRYARRVYQRLSLPWILLLWLLVTMALIGVVLILNRGGGQAACTGSWSTFCAYPAPASGSPSASHGVAGSHVPG